MSYPIYFIDVQVEGCDAGVYLNGAPIVATTYKVKCTAAPTVSEWMLDGTNELAVVISRAPYEEPRAAEVDGEPLPPPRMRVSLCVGAADELVMPGAQRELCVVEWPSRNAVDVRPPMQLHARCTVSHAWGAWRWLASPPLEDAKRSLEEIASAVKLIHASLAAGNTRVVLAASEHKLAEVGRCYSMDPRMARARFRAGWREMSSQPGFQLAALEPEDIVVRRFCQDRLVVPLTRNGEHVIRETDDGSERWALPLYFARVDGLLAVVR